MIIDPDMYDNEEELEAAEAAAREGVSPRGSELGDYHSYLDDHFENLEDKLNTP